MSRRSSTYEDLDIARRDGAKRKNILLQPMSRYKKKMFNEQIRPVAFYLRRLGVAQKKHYFCLRLALKIVLKEKMFCLSMAKKHLGIVLTPRLSGNGSHGRLSTPSRPMKNLQASRLLGRHPRRVFLHKCSVANTLRCLLS